LAVRYGFGWALIGILAILLSPLLPLLEPIATFLGLTVPGLVIAAGAVFLTIVALHLSITLSALQEQIRVLAEENALVEARVTDISREPPAQQVP
jgi:hypothetical protein